MSINPHSPPPLLRLAGRIGRKIRNLSRKAASRLLCGWVTARIEAKWRHDTHHLPLTSDQRELYDIIHRLCWQELGRFPELVNCRDFNDKIQWLKLFDQNHEIVRCSDKIGVRDYVRERVGEDYLVRLYQAHEHFAQIDFDVLPDAFVIKTNHDSGSVILVRDKSRFDRTAAEEKIEAALKKPYGWENGEWAYSYVKPKVFVEEFISPQSAKPPPDYKFYCVEGSVKFCHYIYDRWCETKEQTIDVDGNDLATELYPSFMMGSDFKKPQLWSEMIKTAEILSRGFKCVRVDLYCTDGRIFVGEMTFWPMAGCYKGNGQRKIGRLLDFDRTTYQPFLLPELERTCSRFLLYPNARRT